MSVKNKLIELLDYVEELARLPERAIFSARSYRTMLFFENQLRGKIGINHDVTDQDGPIWIQIDRLQRQVPPVPDEDIRSWLTVSRDPTNPPKVRETLLCTMNREEAEKYVEREEVDEEDIFVSSAGKEDTVEVRLRLDRLPELQSLVDEYCSNAWTDWSIAEIPRRKTISIYDKFFSVLQTLESAGVDNPLEVIFGVGIALWKTQDKTIEHPIVEAFVEISIDPQNHAIQIRPREKEIQVHLKPFSELDIPAVPSLRKRAQKYIQRNDDSADAPEFSPYTTTSFEPILRDSVALLSAEARYWPDVAEDPDDRELPEVGEHLTVTDSWAIYVRTRSSNLFAQDIEHLKQSITEVEEVDLPWAARKLVDKNLDESIQAHGPDLSASFGKPCEAQTRHKRKRLVFMSNVLTSHFLVQETECTCSDLYEQMTYRTRKTSNFGY